MPSTATTRLRLEKQALGENAATWGAPKLNTVLDLVDEAIGGVESIAIAGTTTTLTSSNYASDQARNAVLVLTGTLSANSNVIVPNVEKLYLVVNNTTMGAYSLTIKTAAGSGVALTTGPQWVFCNATNVLTGMPRLDQLAAAGAAINMGGFKVTNSATPTATTDLATKAYVDSIAAGGGVDLSAYATKASPTFTGVVTVPLGSLSSPGITFTGDSNTGIYSPTTDNVVLVSGGTARATASPAGLAVTGALTASSTVTASGVFLGPAGSVSAPSYSFSTDTNSGLYSGGADIVRIATGGADRVEVSAAGDVGIGDTPLTNTNSRTLTISGTNGGTVELCNTTGTLGPRLWGDSSDHTLNLSSHNAAGKIQFRTNGGVVRTTIDASGYLLHGQNSTSTPGYLNTTTGSSLFADGRLFLSGADFHNLNINNDGVLVSLCRSGVAVGAITVSTTATSFNTSSDARLKDDIEPATGALALVAQLGPKKFRFKSEGKGARKRTGFLAQDVQKVCPEAVTGRPDETDPDGRPVHMMIDHSKLVPILWAAVAELAARVEALEARK
jgi:hypothetical protein